MKGFIKILLASMLIVVTVFSFAACNIFNALGDKKDDEEEFRINIEEITSNLENKNYEVQHFDESNIKDSPVVDMVLSMFAIKEEPISALIAFSEDGNNGLYMFEFVDEATAKLAYAQLEAGSKELSNMTGDVCIGIEETFIYVGSNKGTSDAFGE